MNKTDGKLTGIFTIHGIENKNKVKIEHLENVSLKENEYISDKIVKRIELFNGTFAEIYVCYLTDGFLSMSKKLPMFYVSVIHEKPLRRFLLFRVYFIFEITSKITTSKQLLNERLSGKFSLEISIENQRKDLGENIDKFPGNEIIYDKLINFTSSTEMINFSKSLIVQIDKKLEEDYAKEFEYIKPPTKIISLKNYKLD
jgi:hypothetical protein